ncbi:MAG TPA: hypothetical protein VN947_07725 [Polyangia bacterium]|nr:hypothetical protein [Polyangia bacterium]
MTHRLAVAALAAIGGAALGPGCGLDVRPFAGTIMQLTVANAGPTPVGEHLELWARDRYDDILRIDPFYHESEHQSAYGIMIRQAISLDDPCIIDVTGHLLTDAAAYPTTVTMAGVTQTPDEQALAVVQRIEQLAPAGQPPLLAVLPWDATPPPTVAKDATPDERLAACNAYTSASDRAYVANPLQITAPAHGTVFGFIRFISTVPAQNYDGFRLDTPVNLDGVQEIFFTREGDSVDAGQRGPLFLTSRLVPGGRDVVHFELIHGDPNGTESGGASLYVDLGAGAGSF